MQRDLGGAKHLVAAQRGCLPQQQRPPQRRHQVLLPSLVPDRLQRAADTPGLTPGAGKSPAHQAFTVACPQAGRAKLDGKQRDLACTRSTSCCRRWLLSSGAVLHASPQNTSSRPTVWNPAVWPSLPCCADALMASEAAAESCGGCPQAPPSATCITCSSNVTTPRCSRMFDGFRNAMRHCSSALEQAPAGSSAEEGEGFVAAARLKVRVLHAAVMPVIASCHSYLLTAPAGPCRRA